MSDNRSGRGERLERGGKQLPGAATARTNRVSKGRKGKLQFRDLVELALEGKQLRGNEQSSLHTDRVRLRRVLPAIGHLTIRQLTPGRLERFLEGLARGDASHDPVKGATVIASIRCSSSIVQHAVRQRLVGGNPRRRKCAAVERVADSFRHLGSHEQRRLLAAIRLYSKWKVLEVELAIHAGRRRGEQFNARWADWHVQGEP